MRMSNSQTSPKTLPEQPSLPGDGLGYTGKFAFVHKAGEEGFAAVDAVTGQVLINTDTPEWLTDTGAVQAQFSERHAFYSARLESLYTDAMKAPELYAFEDLGWLCTNTEDGTEGVIEADHEHRMEVLTTVLGVRQDIDTEEGTIANTLASQEIAADSRRTGAEMAALTEAQEQGFESVSDARKEGTSGR